MYLKHVAFRFCNYNRNNLIHFISIQFLFINAPAKQPDGQLQKQHSIRI